MGIQSIIHTSYFIIHSTGFPGTITPPPEQQSQKHLPDIEGMSLCPAHPLSDESLEGTGAFGWGLDIGGVDDFVSLSVQSKGELKIFRDRGSPAKSVKEISSDHVDRSGNLFEAPIEFRSASLNHIGSGVFASHSPGDPIL